MPPTDYGSSKLGRRANRQSRAWRQPRGEPALTFHVLILLLSSNSSLVSARFPQLMRRWKHKRYLQGKKQNVLAPQKKFGDALCPCLSASDLRNVTYVDLDSHLEGERQYRPRIDDIFGHDNHANASWNTLEHQSYGLNCASHDKDRSWCANVGDCTTTIPLPVDCDRSYCERSWCYVDADSCQVDHRESWYLLGVSYSYATCGHIEPITYADRRGALSGKQLKVAFNYNTGGWSGAYHPSHQDFALDQDWDGPLVKFMTEASKRGNFTMRISAPPRWLESEAAKFFGQSVFDYCVYATSLGYLDLCLADYSITAQRASVTPFFEVAAHTVVLVVFNQKSDHDSWDEFWYHFRTIFQPFTFSSWAFLYLGMLPFLGLMMFWHERSLPGSAFPPDYQVLVRDPKTGKVEVENKPIPLWRRLFKALYMTALSFFSGSYDLSTVSTGGKIHLLAIMCFLVLVLAVYTANLAAILTTDLVTRPVDNLHQAVQKGYKFCATRKNAVMMSEIHDFDAAKWVVPDPVDGEPGFQCPGCLARQRSLDFMKQGLKKGRDPRDSLYCDAALVNIQDLEALQAQGYHCNKTVVGGILGSVSVGFPIHRRVAEDLTAHLYRLKFDAILEEVLQDARPESKCEEETGIQEEGVGLTISQLAGIWVLVSSFVLAGVLAKWILLCAPDEVAPSGRAIVDKVSIYDQWGNRVEYPSIAEDEAEDSTVQESPSQSRNNPHEEIVFSNQEPSPPNIPTSLFRHVNESNPEFHTFLVNNMDTARPQVNRAASRQRTNTIKSTTRKSEERGGPRQMTSNRQAATIEQAKLLPTQGQLQTNRGKDDRGYYFI